MSSQAEVLSKAIERWVLVTPNGEVLSGHFPTQDQAINAARSMMVKFDSESRIIEHSPVYPRLLVKKLREV